MSAWRSGVVGVMLACAAAGIPAHAAGDEAVVIGSKKFTESVILGEMAVQLARSVGLPARHLAELGGTRVLFNALESGEISAYPDYTGTITHEILADMDLAAPGAVAAELARRGIAMTEPLGFNNTYAIGMRPETADRAGITAISDLRDHPDLAIGLTSEFMDRGDGWPALRRAYRLPHTPRGLDHDVAYRALSGGDIDVMDLYSTDAEIAYYGLRVLRDDLAHFPRYDAVFLYRVELRKTAPDFVAALERLAGSLDETRMRRLNARVKLDGVSDAAAAAAFLDAQLGIESSVVEVTFAGRLWRRTLEHLLLVGISLALAILVAVPVGVVAALRPRAGQAVLFLVGVVQTVPALALLVFMIPILGILAPPAIAALFLYSLLPIVRNTHTGLTGIDPSLRESAEALGLDPRSRIRLIDLPLASPTILAGIKTAAVINVGFATLGALIGAGGYGQPIFTGIRLDDYGLILEGAIPAVVMALGAQVMFELIERRIVPRGLRLKRPV